MSALGKEESGHYPSALHMSAFGCKADIAWVEWFTSTQEAYHAASVGKPLDECYPFSRRHDTPTRFKRGYPEPAGRRETCVRRWSAQPITLALYVLKHQPSR